MRRVAILLALAILSACSSDGAYLPRNGDIIFHESTSAQSMAIQHATGSRYSHMGIVYIRAGEPFVFEAVQPVKATPLREWISRGEGEHFVVKRLKEADRVLTSETLQKMLAAGEALLGRDYDLYFEWSDDRIYCSELVWKIYQRGAGIEIGQRERMGDFDLSHPIIQQKVQERFKGDPPLDEMVISPAAMFAAPNLETVYEN